MRMDGTARPQIRTIAEATQRIPLVRSCHGARKSLHKLQPFRHGETEHRRGDRGSGPSTRGGNTDIHAPESQQIKFKMRH